MNRREIIAHFFPLWQKGRHSVWSKQCSFFITFLPCQIARWHTRLWKGLKDKMVEVGIEVHYILFPVYTHRLIDKERERKREGPIFGLHKVLTSRGGFLKRTWTLELLVLASSTRLNCKVKCRYILLYRPSKMSAYIDEHLSFLLSSACTRWNHCRRQHAWEIQVYKKQPQAKWSWQCRFVNATWKFSPLRALGKMTGAFLRALVKPT